MKLLTEKKTASPCCTMECERLRDWDKRCYLEWGRTSNLTLDVARCTARLWVYPNHCGIWMKNPSYKWMDGLRQSQARQEARSCSHTVSRTSCVWLATHDIVILFIEILHFFLTRVWCNYCCCVIAAIVVIVVFVVADDFVLVVTVVVVFSTWIMAYYRMIMVHNTDSDLLIPEWIHSQDTPTIATAQNDSSIGVKMPLVTWEGWVPPRQAHKPVEWLKFL